MFAAAWCSNTHARAYARLGGKLEVTVCSVSCRAVSASVDPVWIHDPGISISPPCHEYLTRVEHNLAQPACVPHTAVSKPTCTAVRHPVTSPQEELCG